MKRFCIILCGLTLWCGLISAQNRPFTVGESGGKYHLRIDASALGRDVLLTTRVREISGHRNIAAGQTFFPGLVVRLSAENGKLLFASSPYAAAGADDPVARGVANNAVPAFLFVLDARTSGDGSVTADITKFFGEEISGWQPLPGGFKAGKFEASLSGITGYENLENRVNISSRLVSSGAKTAFTLKLSYNLMLLDDPMPVRTEDPRVGYMTNSLSRYPGDGPIRSEKAITRWRIEPKPEDAARHAAGERVEPARPIVFVFDPALPERVRKYAAEGILDWNRAFEAIGFRDAVRIGEYPDNPEDVLVNAVRYIPTDKANAMGATTVDPRSGEIIQGDIYWYHNVEELLAKWLFVQTAAVDPRVRQERIPEELMGAMIRYVAAHEMGHVLGLKHNMRGSYAYPVDSLRSPSFTQRYGTTASIMDYARLNYVAQPGDRERGVNLMPPVLGAYDFMAIQWGYSWFRDGNEQSWKLNGILQNAESDLHLRHVSSQMGPVTTDPAAQSDALGDNVIRSSEYGIANLKTILKHLYAWSEGYADAYSTLSNRYEAVADQYFGYLTNSAAYVGGIYFQPRSAGSLSRRYTGVEETQQSKAVEFVCGELFAYSEWLADTTLFAVIGNRTDLLLKKQSGLLEELVKVWPVRVAQQPGGDCTALFRRMSDLFFSREPQDLFQRTLQSEYISRLKTLSEMEGTAAGYPGPEVCAAAGYELNRLAERLASASRNEKQAMNQAHFQSLLNRIKN